MSAAQLRDSSQGYSVSVAAYRTIEACSSDAAAGSSVVSAYNVTIIAMTRGIQASQTRASRRGAARGRGGRRIVRHEILGRMLFSPIERSSDRSCSQAADARFDSAMNRAHESAQLLHTA